MLTQQRPVTRRIVLQEDRPMPLQLGDAARRTVRGQIGRSRAKAPAALEQLARDQRGVLRLSDLVRDIHVLLQRIDRALSQLNLRVDLRVLTHKLAKHSPEKQLAELDR